MNNKLEILGRKCKLNNPIVNINGNEFDLTNKELSIIRYIPEPDEYEIVADLPSQDPRFTNDSMFNDTIGIFINEKQFKLV